MRHSSCADPVSSHILIFMDCKTTVCIFGMGLVFASGCVGGFKASGGSNASSKVGPMIGVPTNAIRLDDSNSFQTFRGCGIDLQYQYEMNDDVLDLFFAEPPKGIGLKLARVAT